MKKFLLVSVFFVLLTVFFALYGCKNTKNVGNSSTQSQSVSVSAETEQGSVYSIVVQDTEHADINVQSAAKAGTTVYVQITPEEGYYVGQMKVNDKNVTTTTFVMPDCDVLLRIDMRNGSESHRVIPYSCEEGVVFASCEKATIGEEIHIRAVANEGYRLNKLYSGDIELVFIENENGYIASTVMQDKELILSADFVEIERITEDYDFTLQVMQNGVNGLAVSHWRSRYSEYGVEFDILVEDKNVVYTADIAVYNSDNVELQICKATTESRMDAANVIRCLVNAGGRFMLQRADASDLSFAQSGRDIGYVYGENFSTSVVSCTKEKNGFDGYAVHIYLGYDVLGVDNADAKGKITFAPAVRDTVSYDYSTKKLTTYWTGTSYRLSTSLMVGDVTSMKRFFSEDQYKCVWGDPATFLGIAEDNSIVGRFMDVYKNVDYLFMGDSYINPTFWGTYKEDTSDVFSCNIAVSGSHTTHWLDADVIKTVADLSPKNVVVHIGLNDFNIGITDQANKTNTCVQRIKNLLENVHKASADSVIYWIAFVPNYLHAGDYEQYKEVDAEIEKYAEGFSYLNIIDARDVIAPNGYISPALYKADGLHFNCYGYSRFVNAIREGLNLMDLSDGQLFGKSVNAYATSGWEETMQNGENVIRQLGSCSGFSERYTFFKNFYAKDLTVKANFNVERILNGDAAPKFGLMIDDGVNRFFFYVATNNSMKQKAVGYTTFTPSAPATNGYFDWGNAVNKNLSCYFTGDDSVELSLEKNGSKVKMFVNGYEIFTTTISVCTEKVSVGLFSFNTAMSVKNAVATEVNI